jgi:large subunit ribosomal protein L23
MSKTMLLKPRLSEKTYALSTGRVYVFDVPKAANKHDIARAVAAQFEVIVSTVRITNIAGKAKRTISLSGKRVAAGAGGKQVDRKKAYVTLAEGQSLPFFAAVEEAEEKQEETQEKVAKALDKQAKKTDKSDDKPARRGLRRTKKEEEK